MRKRLGLLAFLALALSCGPAASAWNGDWPQRKRIVVSPATSGAETNGELDRFPALLRLHTGSFPFSDAQPDAADFRFVAADDKTPLKHHVELFDPTNELALVWVQLPKVAPSSAPDGEIWLYYGNAKAVPAEDAQGTYDVHQTLVLHFAESGGQPRDATAYGNHPAQSSAKLGASGPIGAAAAFDGSARIVIPASSSLRVGAGGATFSAWVQIAEPQNGAVLFEQRDGGRAITLAIEGSSVIARLATGTGKPVETARSATLTSGAWHHVAVVLKDKLTLYLDGREAASAAASLADLGGELTMGAGFKGLLDEAQVANVARSADWIALSAANQGPDSNLLAVGGDGDAAEEGGTSYFRILLNAVTLDGWVVIGILMLMALVSVAVMIAKGVLVARTSRANEAFRAAFLAQAAAMMQVETETDADATPPARAWRSSSLYRVYGVAMDEIRSRFERYDAAGRQRSLSPQALDAIKASIDAGMVRENERLNSQMVLLTIAISGGPFLGLLGTVVGVMITFAAIAAVGDVNVNSIAPGIAAALVATVAGLGVAIPALFGYNYLASRIRAISNDTAVFSDELVTRLAESYAP
jgi:biopolymer transport protein ExbB